MKNYFIDIATVTTGTATNTCTQLTKHQVVFKHPEVQTVYKISDLLSHIQDY
jgi:hypothetical protein